MKADSACHAWPYLDYSTKYYVDKRELSRNTARIVSVAEKETACSKSFFTGSHLLLHHNDSYFSLLLLPMLLLLNGKSTAPFRRTGLTAIDRIDVASKGNAEPNKRS